MYTVVGGTFNTLHKGHKNLLRAAINTGNPVIIGLTTDSYLEEHKVYKGKPYAARERALRKFLDSEKGVYQILPLESSQGNTETSQDYSHIVVSPETYEKVERINKTRISRGLQPITVVVVPYTLADDLFPISSTRIASGEITPSGRRRTPVRIGVETGNMLKVEATRKAISGLMRNFDIQMVTVPQGSSNQPFGTDIITSSVDRAIRSLSDRDYGIGIEAGIFRDPVTSDSFDMHVCSVVDRFGNLTRGYSSAFQIPPGVQESVKQGMDLSQAVMELYGARDIGQTIGAIGMFSKGKVRRDQLIVECVRNAFIPRMSPEKYGLTFRTFTHNS
ncbi:MAG: pantetheine-phosphate adenylyltransferase [Thermoplasmataceae archaeon]